MLVLLLTARAGRGPELRAGDVIEVADDEGARMIAAGHARELTRGERLDWEDRHGVQNASARQQYEAAVSGPARAALKRPRS